MTKTELEAQFREYIESDDTYILVLYNIAQDLVQYDQNAKDVQILNTIVGSAFALYNSLQNYKEIKKWEKHQVQHRN